METEKVELELKLQADIMSQEDAKYAMFEVKQFNVGVPIEFTSTNQEKKLAKMLG